MFSYKIIFPFLFCRYINTSNIISYNQKKLSNGKIIAKRIVNFI